METLIFDPMDSIGLLLLQYLNLRFQPVLCVLLVELSMQSANGNIAFFKYNF